MSFLTWINTNMQTIKELEVALDKDELIEHACVTFEQSFKHACVTVEQAFKVEGKIEALKDVLGLIDELLIKYKYNPAGLEELKARIKGEKN